MLHAGGQFLHFYVIVFQGLQLQASTHTRFVAFSKVSTLKSIFKSLWSVYVFAGHVWTKAGSVTKCFGVQTNSDMCGQCLNAQFTMNTVNTVIK